MNRSTTLLLGASLFVFSACASSGSTATSAAVDPAPVNAPAATSEAAATASTATAAMASFTDDQADRGREVFRSQCTECHASSEFSDSQFKFKWSRRHAGSLYQMIQTQMPETAPGSLSDEEAVDLVSYILRMNGFEPGSAELSSDRAVLDGISLSSIRN
ncbi:MAG: c-type cytochrome [Longimicrobiales bacterium]